MLLIRSIVIRSPYSFSSAVMVAIQATRLCILVALPCLYFALGTYSKRCIDGAAEGEPLRESSVAQDNDYGTCIGDAASASAPDTDAQEAREILRKRLLGEGDWWAYTKRFAVSHPFVDNILCVYMLADICPVYLAVTRQDAAASGNTCWCLPASTKYPQCFNTICTRVAD